MKTNDFSFSYSDIESEPVLENLENEIETEITPGKNNSQDGNRNSHLRSNTYTHIIGISALALLLYISYNFKVPNVAGNSQYPSVMYLPYVNEKADPPTKTVEFAGYEYGSLGGGDPNSHELKCQRDKYLPLPDAWEIAPDNEDARYVTANYPWNTHVNILANGCGYGTSTYTYGKLWLCDILDSYEGRYKAKYCYTMILIRKIKLRKVNYAPEPKSIYTFKGWSYASLDGANYDEKNSLKCQYGKFLALPEGWEIAPDEEDVRNVVGTQPWATHVNVLSNGCGYGTSIYSQGQRWWCNMLKTVPYNGVNEYSVNTCWLMILIRKPAPTSEPTLLPTYSPTHAPIAHPSHEPTYEPTYSPTKQPVSHPTLEPTFEPTKNPVPNPVAHPTQEPTYEPTRKPTLKPTEQPVLDPTLEPTPFPTFKQTTFPTSKPITPLPTYEPTYVPVEEDNYCTYTFTKGSSGVDVAEGCMLVTVDDIEFMVDGKSTHALYACSTRKKPVKLDKATLMTLGFLENMSIIYPGDDSKVTFYSDDNFGGMSKSYTKEYHPKLLKCKYDDKSKCNDEIRSLTLESDRSKASSLRDECSNKP